jgi:multidrug efflux pump subunit AcrB
MNFATWSIRNPIPSIVLFFLLTLAGFWGLHRLGVQDFPDLDLPTINVTLRLPGAAPSQLETDVARKVEDSMATLEGLKHLRTQITDGSVSIIAEFVLERPLSDALTDVKDAVDRVRNDLPVDVEQPQVTKVTVGPGGPIMTFAVTSSSLDEEGLSWFVDDTIARTLLAVPGVGEFDRVGGGQREVQVDVDLPRLNSLGLTVTDVSRAVKRVQQDASGGRGQLGGAEQSVRTVATVAQAADLARLPVAISNDHWVRLDEVAQVRDTLADRTTAARLDGHPAVAFQILRSKGYNVIDVAAGVEGALAKLESEHPGLKVQKVISTVTHTEEQYQGSMRMLYEGAALAVVVVLIFLRDWRATIVGAAALPLSIIPTFAVMQWAGFTLNTITLLALSVVVGILVDDAIVEVENIARHVRMGKSVREATEEAVTEIALPVLATTMALVVVFLPTAFMRGIPGLVFRQFGWTAVAAILASLLVARLGTPMMAAWLMKGGGHEERDGWLMRSYLRAVRWCLDHRWITMALAAAFFVGSLSLIPFIPKGFIPPEDRGYTAITVETPPGSSLATTLAATEAARLAIIGGDHPVPGIANILSAAGSATAPTAGEVRKGSLTITLTPVGTRPDQITLENMIRERLRPLPGARFSMGNGGPGEKLEILLTGRDIPTLKATAQNIERELRGVSYLSGVTSSASLERPEIVVHPRATAAAERGVSAQSIGETLRIATSGDFTPSLAKLNLDNRQIGIRVRIPEVDRQNLDTVGTLRVPGRGGLLPLSTVADISVESGPSQIDRYDRNRFVSVKADLGGYPLGTALAAAKALPAVRDMPSSVRLVGSGDAEVMAELFGGFGLAMLIGVLCVYCVLILLFKDFFQPVTILSAVPLSLGGAFVSLLAGHAEIGLPALIGLVMLLGIVTKNSILLVEYAIVGIEQRGLSQRDGLIDACHKRARPIVMTTVAMVAGMLPLALGLDGGNHFRQTMATAVIGGLITSTALSLLVVPAAFTFVAGFERRLRRLLAPRRAAAGVLPPDELSPREAVHRS